MRTHGKHAVRLATVPRAVGTLNPEAKEDLGLHAAFSARLAYVSAGTKPGTYVYASDVAPAITIKRQRRITPA